MKTVVATVAAKMERLFGQPRDSIGIAASQDFGVSVDTAPSQRLSSAPASTTMTPMSIRGDLSPWSQSPTGNRRRDEWKVMRTRVFTPPRCRQ